MPALIVRVLMNFYIGNFVRVQWSGIVSDYFLAGNGVKQGGVLSPVLFCLYIDGLLMALSKAGVGCFVGDNFVGALAYADDIVLLAPAASTLRIIMLKIYDMLKSIRLYLTLVNQNVWWYCLEIAGVHRILYGTARFTLEIAQLIM